MGSFQLVGFHICRWGMNLTLPFRAQSVVRSWSPYRFAVTTSLLVSTSPITGKMSGAMEKPWMEKFYSKDTVGRCFLHSTTLLDKYCSVIQKLPLKINYLQQHFWTMTFIFQRVENPFSLVNCWLQTPVNWIQTLDGTLILRKTLITNFQIASFPS